MNVIERLGKAGLVPVVVIDKVEDAVPAARALLAGGLDIMEITMRTAAGIEAIRSVRTSVPEMLVGAGTILSLEKCIEAAEAGAQFIVSPGFDAEIVSWCVEHDVAVTPGCVTPTEIQQALALGVYTVKFIQCLRRCCCNECIKRPFKSVGVKFIPTGGVNNDNLSEYAVNHSSTPLAVVGCVNG